MQGITYRRALNSDFEAIQKMLKATFKEYEIDLPDNYSFSDIENLEEAYLNATGEFIVLLREKNIIGFFALLPSNNNQIEPSGYGSYLLTLSLNCREHLKVTTLLGSSIISSPVEGFLPRRSCFVLTQNFPKRLTSTSSPDSKVCLMISSSVSISSNDWFFV